MPVLLGDLSLVDETIVLPRNHSGVSTVPSTDCDKMAMGKMVRNQQCHHLNFTLQWTFGTLKSQGSDQMDVEFKRSSSIGESSA
jgi:hypothetical protein